MKTKISKTPVIAVLSVKIQKLLFSLLFFALFSFSSLAQDYVDHPVETKDGLTKALPGTFQLIFNSNQSNPIYIDSDLLELIESKRTELESVIYILNSEVKILIPSIKTIREPNYIPFNDEFIVESK